MDQPCPVQPLPRQSTDRNCPLWSNPWTFLQHPVDDSPGMDAEERWYRGRQRRRPQCRGESRWRGSWDPTAREIFRIEEFTPHPEIERGINKRKMSRNTNFRYVWVEGPCPVWCLSRGSRSYTSLGSRVFSESRAGGRLYMKAILGNMRKTLLGSDLGDTTQNSKM